MSGIVPNRQTDYLVSVASGNVSGQSLVLLTSRNADIDTAVEDIIPQGGTWAQPTADRIHDITSSSVNDTAAGTGMRTIKIFGLSGGNMITETISLNGNTNVPTANSYGIIYQIEGLTAGSLLTNEGTITATAQTDATVTITIPPSYGQADLGVFQVPTGYTGYLLTWEVGFYQATPSVVCQFLMYHKKSGGIWHLQTLDGLASNGTSNHVQGFDGGFKMEQGSLIKTSAIGSNANNDCFAKYNILLIKN